MRLAPVPIRFANLFPDQLDELVTYCVDSSRPTHASPQCLSACVYFGLVLAGLIHGIDRDAEDFRVAVLRAVNLGDAADATGAVCGQLAGAYWGEAGIPVEWRKGLARPEMIERAVGGLLGGQE